MIITAKEFLATPDPWGFTKHELGSGLYGAVFATADDRKVIKNGELIDGWPAYALWCLEKNRGPSALKVHAIRFDGSRSEYWALIERCEETLEARHDRLKGELPRDAKFADRLRRQQSAWQLAERFPSFLKLKAEIKETFPQYNFDLHDNNVMFRPDGHVVITDPLSGAKAGDPTDNLLTKARSSRRGVIVN